MISSQSPANTRLQASTTCWRHACNEARGDLSSPRTKHVSFWAPNKFNNLPDNHLYAKESEKNLTQRLLMTTIPKQQPTTAPASISGKKKWFSHERTKINSALVYWSFTHFHVHFWRSRFVNHTMRLRVNLHLISTVLRWCCKYTR